MDTIIKTDKESKENIKAQKLMIENFMNTLIFKNNPECISDVLSIVENPFVNKAGVDAISLLFHRFYKNTDIPIVLPIFGFLSIISAWLVKSEATMKIPYTTTKTELATWVMALAQSGSNKTLSMKQILDMIPVDLQSGEKVIEPNVAKPDGPKAFVQQLSKLDNNRGFWFQDEASQMFKGIENVGSPMSEMKEYLLKIKDHDKVERLNAKEHIVVKGTVMTQFFINTIDSMARTLSQETMEDGLFRRYQIAIAEKDDERVFTNYAFYELDKLKDDTLENELQIVFSQEVKGNHYTFDNDCILLYKETFKRFWDKQYSYFMEGSENFYRTYMMESFKYAVFHHVINKKEGTVIDAFSLQYGLKVSMFLLNSLQRFIQYRAGQKSIQVQKSKIEKIMDFVAANENTKGFCLRVVCRKFNMKKEDVMATLKSIKKNDKKFKTKLLNQE